MRTNRIITKAKPIRIINKTNCILHNSINDHSFSLINSLEITPYVYLPKKFLYNFLFFFPNDYYLPYTIKIDKLTFVQ